MAGSKETTEAKPAAQASRQAQQLCCHLLKKAPWTKYIQDPLIILKMLKQQQIQMLNEQSGSVTKFIIESIPTQPMRKTFLVKSVIHKLQAIELERLKEALLSVNDAEIKDQIIRLFDRITQHLVLMDPNITFLPPVGIVLPPHPPIRHGNSTFYVVDEGLLWSELFEDIAQAGDVESLHDFLNKPGIQSENVWLSAEKDSPFHASIESGHLSWCRAFIEEIMKCDDRKFERACPFKKIELINLGNTMGNTALHLAVRKELFLLVKCLLSFGANPYIPNGNGITPLDLMYERLPEGVIYLLTAGSAGNSVYRMSTTGKKDIQLEIDFGAIVSRHEETKRIGLLDYLRPGCFFSSCCCPEPSPNSTRPETNEAACRKTTTNSNPINLSMVQIKEINDVHVKSTPIPESVSLLTHTSGKKMDESIEIIVKDSPSSSSEITHENEDSKAECPRHNKSQTPEMELLARAVYTNWRKSAKPILSHVVAKTFLDLKWKTLKTRVYLLTLFYMFTYLNQMAFVVHMYSNRSMPGVPKDSSNNSALEFTHNSNLNDTMEVFKTASISTRFWPSDYTIKFVWACTTAGCLGVFGWLEVFEFGIIARTFSVPFCRQSNTVIRCLSSFGYKIWFYLNNIENVLQLPFFVTGMITVAKAMEGILTDYQIEGAHEFAAWSAVLAGILVLFQLDNFEFDGAIYVQIFKVVLDRFVRTLVVIFVCISAGYCVAFSVIMKQEIFALPVVIFRAISMMAGEFNYDAIFDPKDPQTFYYNSQMIFASFTIIITIFLVSLLVGLAVDDIKQTRVESEDILRRVRVNRMFILERLSAWWGLCGEGMFVLPSCSRRKNSPCILRENLRELSGKLHKEWRLLSDDGAAYHREYFCSFFQFASEIDMGGRQDLKSESLVA